MNPTPKTIQIFLPGGDPRGIRIAEITTGIIQVIEVPRPLLSDFLSMPESNQVALYFLTAKPEDAEPEVYIGQTSDLNSRLKNHNREKDFWQHALVLIPRTQNLTQTHMLFLEWHSLRRCREAGRYNNENGNSGSRPHTPAPLEAECHEVFNTARILLTILGYPVFEPVAKSSTPLISSENEKLFHCRGSGSEGTGLYTSEGFVVLKGSSGLDRIVRSASQTLKPQRAKLIQTGILKRENDRISFQKDHLFSSPSSAAMNLLGRTANGWIEWKTADGRTLDELKRQSTDSLSTA